MTTELHSLLMEHLEIEGSSLKIEKANSDNLDWSWRVTYSNGSTGQGITFTGSSLQGALWKFGRIAFGRTESKA